MHIWRPIDIDKAKADQIYAWIGTGVPPNMKPCTEADYWGMVSSYMPLCTVYHSYAKRADGKWSTWQVAVYGDGHSIARGGFVVDIPNERDVPVKYYTWATCEHSFVAKKLGNCYHSYMCKHCGSTYTVDSSD